ncbi:MAG: SRPBCC family protein [Gemmatimonadota bacterium]
MPATLTRATITTPTDREIHIERIVNAPRAQVWRAYADPALVSQWWGRGNRLDIERMEFTRGGHWRYVEHAAKGISGFEGRYREVTAPERFIRSFEWDGMPAHVAIEFVTLTDLGDGRTRINIIMQMHTPEERDGFLQSGMQGGMDASFAELDKLLSASRS